MTAVSTQTKWRLIFLPLLLLLVLFSCQKLIDEGNIAAPIIPVDLTTKVSSSVSGFVTDENDEPVQSASVKVGLQTVTTDEYGYFEVRNEQVVKSAATVSVSMAGYFAGIRTYMAEQNKAAFVRIKLIPKNTSGNFSGSTGGTVTLPDGLKISFPANAVVNATTGSAYTGTINVAASWINPTAPDLERIMPGDLRGVDASGGFKQLTTYGMAAVELTGSTGEKLQVTPGKKVALSFPVPSALLASAPATIPLWYFDETTGLWKEEGTAVKTGSFYEGQVSHFSFWNCDVPGNFVQVNMTVKDNNGNPVPYAQVKISRVSNPNSASYGYTDSSGYVGGAIPSNEQLKLEIFSNASCGTPLHTQTFSSGTTNVSLGIITINVSQGAAVVSGTATTCSNTPVVNGFLIMKKGNQYFRYPISNSGTFQFSTTLCNNTATSIQLIAEDISAGQQSYPTTHTINPGNNAVGILQACGVTTQQFMNLTINSVTYNYTAPVDSLTLRPEQSGTISTGFYLTAFRMVTPFRSTSLMWSGGGIAAGSTQSLIMFRTQEISDSTVMINPVNVNISEYGSVGQFVSGNFTGTFRGAAPANTNYNITCSFRVRRYF